MKTAEVLIVDDNETLASTFGLLLSNQGYRVATAYNGSQAMEVVSEAQVFPKFAIVDLRMPDLDGPTTIKALRERSPELQVIAVSGQTLRPYFARLADLGVRHFLRKPFVLDELLDTIREMQQVA